MQVLETCVKNCGRRFHLLISQKDFILDLVKLIGPKNDPPTAVQEKVLSLIQVYVFLCLLFKLIVSNISINMHMSYTVESQ